MSEDRIIADLDAAAERVGMMYDDRAAVDAAIAEIKRLKAVLSAIGAHDDQWSGAEQARWMRDYARDALAMEQKNDIVERLRCPDMCAGQDVPCRVKDARSACACAEAADEIERLRSLLDDKQYIQFKADYNRGHLSHHGWLAAREAEQKND